MKKKSSLRGEWSTYKPKLKMEKLGVIIKVPEQVKIVDFIGVDADGNFYKLAPYNPGRPA